MTSYIITLREGPRFRLLFKWGPLSPLFPRKIFLQSRVK